MSNSYKFNFFTQGSLAPDYSYIFSFLAIILLFILSFLGISLSLSNVLLGAVASLSLAVLLYLLVKRLELIKIGTATSGSALTWLFFILVFLISFFTAYHYLHNYISDINAEESSSNNSYLYQKAKEMRITSELYASYSSELDQMKNCENGILDIDKEIINADAKKDEFLQIAASIKSPINIIRASEALGSEFTIHRDAIIQGFTAQTIGECASPVATLQNINYNALSKDFGLMSSLENINLGIFLPLFFILPFMLLLPFIMALSKTEKIKKNPFHPGSKK